MMGRVGWVSVFVLAGLSHHVSAMDVGELSGARFSIGGYVKAEGVFNKPDQGKDTTEASARQTRLNLALEREVQNHQLKAFIEGDFWGHNTEHDSGYDWRLRHAYIEVDQLTVGQTWNGQFFANAPFDVEIINFWGAGAGTIAGNGAVIRPDLVMHYRHRGWRFSLQDPVYSSAHYPDMVAAYTYRAPEGHLFNVAVTGREVETAAGESEFGAALSVAGKFNFGNTRLALSAYTGEGAGIYAGWGYNGARGESTSDVNADGELIRTTGFSAGIVHSFSNRLKGTMRYGQVSSSEVVASLDHDTLKMANVNLVYTFLPGLDLGIEWRDQNAATRPPSAAASSIRPAGQQLELMALYRF